MDYGDPHISWIKKSRRTVGSRKIGTATATVFRALSIKNHRKHGNRRKSSAERGDCPHEQKGTAKTAISGYTRRFGTSNIRRASFYRPCRRSPRWPPRWDRKSSRPRPHRQPRPRAISPSPPQSVRSVKNPSFPDSHTEDSGKYHPGSGDIRWRREKPFRRSTDNGRRCRPPPDSREDQTVFRRCEAFSERAAGHP